MGASVEHMDGGRTNTALALAIEAGDMVAGAYRVVREVGCGGMGVVYLAERVSDGRHVALKLLKRELLADKVLCERLRREAQLVKRADHPNVVALLDHGDAGALGPYLVFEFLEGASLAEEMEDRRPIAAARAVAVMTEVLLALDAAHAAGVIHRDLKPENVFLCTTPEGGAGGGEDGETTVPRVKVLDFGVSRTVQDALSNAASRLTQAGSVVGTPLYMAPEQALADHAQDHRVDVYAAGVVLYEMLCARLPHEGESYGQVIAHALHREAAPLLDYNPLVDRELAEIVHRAIAREPRDRFANAHEFLEALAAWRVSFQARCDDATGRASALDDDDAERTLVRVRVGPESVPPAVVPAGSRRTPARAAGRGGRARQGSRALVAAAAVLLASVVLAVGVGRSKPTPEGTPGRGLTVARATARPVAAPRDARNVRNVVPTPVPAPEPAAPTAASIPPAHPARTTTNVRRVRVAPRGLHIVLANPYRRP